MDTFESDLDTRLEAQARPTPVIDSGSVKSLIGQAELRVRRTRRRWLALGLTSVLTCGVVAVPATAIAINVFNAQSGVFNREADGSSPSSAVETIDPGTEGSPGSEWIDMGSSDLEQYMASVAPRDLPLPTGVTWDDVLNSFFDRFSQSEYLESNNLGGGGVRAESIVIDQMLENEARRAWLVDWFEAYESGDSERMVKAGSALGESVDWPAEQQATRGSYAEETRTWMRIIGQGDFDAAQAYAYHLQWVELWDGQDRTPLRDAILGGLVTEPGEDGTL